MSPAVVAVALCVVASAFDVRSRRIPNALTFGAVAAALAFHGWTRGLEGILGAASGFGVGFALFFPMFALGGMGAGDVKLLAALGAWLGPAAAAWTALYAAMAGGVMAVALAVARGVLSATASRTWVCSLASGEWRDPRPMDGMTLATSKSPTAAIRAADHGGAARDTLVAVTRRGRWL